MSLEVQPPFTVDLTEYRTQQAGLIYSGEKPRKLDYAHLSTAMRVHAVEHGISLLDVLKSVINDHLSFPATEGQIIDDDLSTLNPPEALWLASRLVNDYRLGIVLIGQVLGVDRSNARERLRPFVQNIHRDRLSHESEEAAEDFLDLPIGSLKDL